MTDHDIDKLYKLQSKEVPPTVVDNNITELAQQSIKATSVIKSKSKISTHQYMPYTLVASAMFIGVLILNFPQNYINPPNEILQENKPKSRLHDSEMVAPLTEKSMLPKSSMDTQQALTEMNTYSSKLKKEAITQRKTLEAQRSSQKASQVRLNKHALLTQISENVTLKRINKAKEIAKKYKDEFGLDQLPQKYHYLIIKEDK